MFKSILCCIVAMSLVEGGRAITSKSSKVCSVPVFCTQGGVNAREWKVFPDEKNSQSSSEDGEGSTAEMQQRLDDLENSQTQLTAQLAALTVENANMRDVVDELKVWVEEKTEDKFTQLEDFFNKRLPPVFCAFVYGDSCYWAVVHEVWDVNAARGDAICQEKGGHRANVYSPENYQEIVYTFRRMIPGGQDYIQLWLGMKRDQNTGKVTLSDGSSAPYTKWRPSNPSSNAVNTDIFVLIRTSPEHQDRDMTNYVPTQGLHGVVCQRTL